jgi:GxxExxY protein
MCTVSDVPYEPNPLVQRVLGGAIEVHRTLGPGLLESAYQRCLAYELRSQRIAFDIQVPLPVLYKGVPIECGYRLDFVVEGSLVLEIKAVDGLMPIHKAQLLTYLKLLPASRGLLINFNVPRLMDGVRSLLLPGAAH